MREAWKIYSVMALIAFTIIVSSCKKEDATVYSKKDKHEKFFTDSENLQDPNKSAIVRGLKNTDVKIDFTNKLIPFEDALLGKTCNIGLRVQQM
jgi:hypothetical protein